MKKLPLTGSMIKRKAEKRNCNTTFFMSNSPLKGQIMEVE
jgi:hypothetical protein